MTQSKYAKLFTSGIFQISTATYVILFWVNHISFLIFNSHTIFFLYPHILYPVIFKITGLFYIQIVSHFDKC